MEKIILSDCRFRAEGEDGQERESNRLLLEGWLVKREVRPSGRMGGRLRGDRSICAQTIQERLKPADLGQSEREVSGK